MIFWSIFNYTLPLMIFYASLKQILCITEANARISKVVF